MSYFDVLLLCAHNYHDAILFWPCYSTPLHIAITSNNAPVFTTILPQPDLDLDHVNSAGHTVLSLALQHEPATGCYDDASFAAQLLKRGCSLNTIEKDSGDTLIHSVARLGNQTAAFFLLDNGCNANIPNVTVYQNIQ